ncbi:MAG TPA: hypothetical protein VFV65_09030 [Gemmatimonadales bacterium]|nr:hypothetical protein [Gemmatimonadales bacterium]
MTAAPGWFERRTAGAPEALRSRAASFLGQAPAGAGWASQLAAAAGLALESTLRQGGDRSTALDLLTADGLLTLALLAEAEEAPDRLESFAADIVSAASA